MEETQAIDFADFPVEDDYTQAAGVGTDQVCTSRFVISVCKERVQTLLTLSGGWRSKADI